MWDFLVMISRGSLEGEGRVCFVTVGVSIDFPSLTPDQDPPCTPAQHRPGPAPSSPPTPPTISVQLFPSSLLPACLRQKARVVCFPNSGPVLWSPTRKEGGAPRLPHIKVPSQRTRAGRECGQGPAHPPFFSPGLQSMGNVVWGSPRTQKCRGVCWGEERIAQVYK